MSKSTTYAANYMKTFRCIGPDCEDTCCSGWRVTLFKKDVARLKSYLVENRRASTLSEMVVLDPAADNESGEFGYFNFSWDGSCPIMEGGICTLHRDRGETAIPTLCATFPRKFLKIKDGRELHGQFSCPEVVRRCLLDESANTMSPLAPDQMPGRFEISAFDASDPYHQGLILARGYIDKVLARPDLSLFQKNMNLVSFCKRIAAFCRQDSATNPCPRLEKTITRLLAGQGSVYTPKNSRGWPDLMLELVTGIAGLRAQPCNNPRFRTMCGKIYGSYGQIGEQLLAGKSISAGLRMRLWQVYLVRRDKIDALLGSRIERCLSRFCEAFWHQDLFSGAGSPAESAHKLPFFLAVIRFMLYSHPNLEERVLMGPQASEEPLLDATLVAVVQIFSKYIASDSALVDQIQAAMAASGLDTVANLSLFLEI